MPWLHFKLFNLKPPFKGGKALDMQNGRITKMLCSQLKD